MLIVAEVWVIFQVCPSLSFAARIRQLSDVDRYGWLCVDFTACLCTTSIVTFYRSQNVIIALFTQLINLLDFVIKLQIAFSDEEKKMVEEVFNNAIDCLSDEDKKLPQVRED